VYVSFIWNDDYLVNVHKEVSHNPIPSHQTRLVVLQMADRQLSETQVSFSHILIAGFNVIIVGK
jgi:hypothetical protein